MTPRKRLFDFDHIKLAKLILKWEHSQNRIIEVLEINDFVNDEISRNVHEALDELILELKSTRAAPYFTNEIREIAADIKSRYPAKKEKT